MAYYILPRPPTRRKNGQETLERNSESGRGLDHHFLRVKSDQEELGRGGQKIYPWPKEEPEKS